MAFSQISSNPSNVLSILDSMSSLLNPYPLISQAIDSFAQKYAQIRVLYFLNIITGIYALILLQTIVILSFKLYRQKGSRKAFYPWRTSYRPNQTLPHLVPNGNFWNDFLQILCCISTEWFVIVIYVAVRDPGSISPIMISSGLLCLAISFPPIFIGLWLNGWNSIYIGFLSPSRGEAKIPVYRFLQHPILMNSICIGTSIFILVYFVFIGINLFIKSMQLTQLYHLMLTEIAQLSESWKPQNPQNSKNNHDLFDIILALCTKGNQIYTLLMCVNYGVAVISFFIAMFYLFSTFSLGRVFKRALRLRLAGEKNSTHDDKQLQTGSSEAYSEDTCHFILKGDRERTLQLQRTYYFLSASSYIICASTIFQTATAVSVGFKAKSFLEESDWQLRICALATCSLALSAASLFLQSILHIWNDSRERRTILVKRAVDIKAA